MATGAECCLLMVQPGLSHSNSASVWRCGALHIPQSSGTLAQAGLPLSAPQPVDLGEFFALIRPPFKQVKQKQHLNRPGSLHQRFICKLLPFCSWSDGKCWVRWSLYHFLICTLTAKKKVQRKYIVYLLLKSFKSNFQTEGVDFVQFCYTKGK